MSGDLRKEFDAFRDEVDCDHNIDPFDFALGWLAGRGMPVLEAIDLAELWSNEYRTHGGAL